MTTSCTCLRTCNTFFNQQHVAKHALIQFQSPALSTVTESTIRSGALLLCRALQASGMGVMATTGSCTAWPRSAVLMARCRRALASLTLACNLAIQISQHVAIHCDACSATRLEHSSAMHGD